MNQSNMTFLEVQRELFAPVRPHSPQQIFWYMTDVSLQKTDGRFADFLITIRLLELSEDLTDKYFKKSNQETTQMGMVIRNCGRRMLVRRDAKAEGNP